jgi:hypothetical protein
LTPLAKASSKEFSTGLISIDFSGIFTFDMSDSMKLYCKSTKKVSKNKIKN